MDNSGLKGPVRTLHLVIKQTEIKTAASLWPTKAKQTISGKMCYFIILLF